MVASHSHSHSYSHSHSSYSYSHYSHYSSPSHSSASLSLPPHASLAHHSPSPSYSRSRQHAHTYLQPHASPSAQNHARRARPVSLHLESFTKRRQSYEAALEFWEETTAATEETKETSYNIGSTPGRRPRHRRRSSDNLFRSSSSSSPAPSPLLSRRSSYDPKYRTTPNNKMTGSSLASPVLPSMTHMADFLVLAGQGSVPASPTVAPPTPTPAASKHSLLDRRRRERKISVASSLSSSSNNKTAPLPSPTLQEVVQFALTIPLPPSREPSLSPQVASASTISSDRKYSPSPRIAASPLSHSIASSVTLPQSRPSSQNSRYKVALTPEQAAPHAPTQQQQQQQGQQTPSQPSPFIATTSTSTTNNITTLLNKPSTQLSTSQSQALHLLSSNLNTPPLARRSSVHASPSPSTARADRILHRRSLGAPPRISHTSPIEQLLAGLEDLRIAGAKSTRKRSFGHVETDPVPVMSATAIEQPVECSRSPTIYSTKTSPVISRSDSFSLRTKRRESSPFPTGLPDASLLDASFAVAAIGDKTYDELEVAIETNRERRKSLGLLRRRPATTSLSSVSAISGASEETSGSAATPPLSATSTVPFTMRRSPPARLATDADEANRTPLRTQSSMLTFDKSVNLKKSTIFTNVPEADALLDSESFQLTPPGSAEQSPVIARRTPLRPQPSVSLFEQQVALKKSTIFTRGTDPETLLDSESFQLTPPSTVRTPNAGRTANTPLRTPLGATLARTPRSLLASRNAPMPPPSMPPPTMPLPRIPTALAEDEEETRTPTKTIDNTIDLGALIRTGRPKRPSGTEESFLAAAADGVNLADLSADDGDMSMSPVKQLVPEELRPKRDEATSASMAQLDARGLPVAGAALPRSDSTRGLVQTKRTSLLAGASRLAPSGSTRSIGALARGVTTPRRTVDRTDVPLTMRRDRTTSTATTSSETDRWADAVERDPQPAQAAAPTAERRVPSSVSTRRLSTVGSTGLTRSGSTRTALNIPDHTAAIPRSGSTRFRERPSAAAPATATVPRSGSSRAVGTERPATAQSAGGMSRASSSRSLTKAEPTPATRTAARTTASRVSAPPATATAASRAAASRVAAATAAARTPAASRVSAPPASTRPTAAPRSSLAPRTTAPRTSLAPRSSLAPRTSLAPVPAASTATTPAAPRRSLLPPARTTTTAATATGTAASRLSSRPSLAPRSRPFGDAAPATNRTTIGAAARTKTSVPATPSRDAAERATVGPKRNLSTPATVTGRRSLGGETLTTAARRQSTMTGTLPTLNEFGMPATGAARARPSTVGVRARIGEIESRRNK